MVQRYKQLDKNVTAIQLNHNNKNPEKVDITYSLNFQDAKYNLYENLTKIEASIIGAYYFKKYILKKDI